MKRNNFHIDDLLGTVRLLLSSFISSFCFKLYTFLLHFIANILCRFTFSRIITKRKSGNVRVRGVEMCKMTFASLRAAEVESESRDVI